MYPPPGLKFTMPPFSTLTEPQQPKLPTPELALKVPNTFSPKDPLLITHAVPPVVVVTVPPASMVTSSRFTVAVTVTTWPFRMLMAPLALVGVAVAFTHVFPPSVLSSHVARAFQFPLALLRYMGRVS